MKIQEQIVTDKYTKKKGKKKELKGGKRTRRGHEKERKAQGKGKTRKRKRGKEEEGREERKRGKRKEERERKEIKRKKRKEEEQQKQRRYGRKGLHRPGLLIEQMSAFCMRATCVGHLKMWTIGTMIGIPSGVYHLPWGNHSRILTWTRSVGSEPGICDLHSQTIKLLKNEK
jgi:hypothetical protein